MKKLIIPLFLSLFSLLCLSPVYAAPGALVFESEYTFGTVPDGTIVLHDFIIKNNKDVIVKINNVKPGWGCTAVSFDREIQPGGQGIIKIKVKTDGYGGRTLKKKIKVLTDDLAMPTLYLTIQGAVEKVVDITPKSLVFQGDCGTVMEKTITIIPIPKYPLNVLSLKFKTGKYMTGTLEKTQINGKQAYKVIVKTKKEAAGNFYDKVTLKTDSRVKPIINVWVKVRLKDNPVVVPAKE